MPDPRMSYRAERRESKQWAITRFWNTLFYTELDNATVLSLICFLTTILLAFLSIGGWGVTQHTVGLATGNTQAYSNPLTVLSDVAEMREELRKLEDSVVMMEKQIVEISQNTKNMDSESLNEQLSRISERIEMLSGKITSLEKKIQDMDSRINMNSSYVMEQKEKEKKKWSFKIVREQPDVFELPFGFHLHFLGDSVKYRI